MNTNLAQNPKLLAALAGLAALVLYLPLLRAGFVLGDAYTIAQMRGSPLAGLSLLVDRSVWGMSPAGFHLTNALLHAANTALVFAAGYLLFKKDSPLPAFLAALLFAFHPANTEAVSWISARAELIFTMFFLLAFVSYLHYERHGGVAGLVLTGIFFFLSMMANEKALAFAALLPLYVAAVDSPDRVKRLAVAAAICVLTLGGFYLVGPLLPGIEAELAIKGHLLALGITPGLGLYAGKLLLPLNHDLLPGMPENLLYVLAGFALLAGTALLYLWRLRLEAFLAAWVIIALVPSFFAIDPSGAVLAERHMYLSAAAFSVLLASVLWRIKSRPVLVAASLAIVAAYSLSATVGAADWKDEDRLLSSALARDAYSLYEDPSQASHVLTMLGVREMEEGEYEKAREHLREAIAADEKNYMAYYHSGRLFESLHAKLAREGNVRAQKALSREAAEVLEKGSEHFQNHVYLHYNLGIWYMRLYRWDEAEAAFMTVLGLNSGKGMAEASADFLSLIKEIKKRGVGGYNAPSAQGTQ